MSITIVLPAQFQSNNFTPSLDTTGINPLNAVINERQSFTLDSNQTFITLIPTYAPFFANNFTLTLLGNNNNNTLLVPGVDYFFAYPFIGASRACKQPVFCGINISSLLTIGTVVMNYNTLGGDWVLPYSNYLSILNKLLNNPSSIALEQVANYPTLFPNLNNVNWNQQDSTNLLEVEEAMLGISKAIMTKAISYDYNDPIAHLINFSNPHQLTTVEIGLDKVNNLPPASDLTATNILNNIEYISTSQVKTMILNEYPDATISSLGIMYLNLNESANDSTDITKGLTITGFTSLLGNQQNTIGQTFNRGQQLGFVTPFPFTYPITWNGNVYNTQSDFISAVANSVNLKTIEYNKNTGCFYFPYKTPIPNLTHT